MPGGRPRKPVPEWALSVRVFVVRHLYCPEHLLPPITSTGKPYRRSALRAPVRSPEAGAAGQRRLEKGWIQAIGERFDGL